jgi:ABC-type branched-subunit amino acid transport system substrate-binding protein
VIKLGATYATDEATFQTLVGSPGAVTQNYEQEQQSLWQLGANYINDSGGLDGCKVEMVYYNFPATASDGWSAESQTECTQFAQDDHVFAVINTSFENKTLIDCLAQNHVVDFYDGPAPAYQPTPQDFSQLRGYLYQPDYINSYRFGSFIDQLQQAGYFGSGAKVGILLADDGSGNNQYVVNTLWKPALAALGLTPVIFTYSEAENYSREGDLAEQFSSAVLEFKGANVDHVILTPDGGESVITFTAEAESQGYTPRYAMTSDSNPVAWPDVQSAERPNAMAVSYSVFDLATSSQVQSQIATDPASANRNECNAIYSGHTGSEPVSSIYWMCDVFFFLRSALSGASTVNSQNLLSGADRLGKSFPLADGIGTGSFGPPDHYDGATMTRVMEWNQSASSWQYVTRPEEVP